MSRFLILVALLISAGCTETVDPFVGEARPFTLWGYLETTADTQRVRVFSIEERIGIDRAGPLDAVVTSTDLDTGARHVWQDAVVTYGPGNTGHVFWSAFRPEPGHRYRLEVARGDGAVTRAEVTVPPPVTVTVPEEPALDVKIPITIDGDAPNLVGLGVTYEAVTVYPLQPFPPGTSQPDAIVFPYTVPYGAKAARVPGGWRFEVNLKADAALVREEFQRNCLTEDVALRRIEFSFLAADEGWAPPGGTFDPDLLAQPGTFSNVDNGYGFFGAGQTVRIRWVPSAQLQSRSGFALTPPCPLSPNPRCVVKPPCFRCKEDLPDDIRRVFCPIEAQ